MKLGLDLLVTSCLQDPVTLVNYVDIEYSEDSFINRGDSQDLAEMYQELIEAYMLPDGTIKKKDKENLLGGLVLAKNIIQECIEQVKEYASKD